MYNSRPIIESAKAHRGVCVCTYTHIMTARTHLLPDHLAGLRDARAHVEDAELEVRVGQHTVDGHVPLERFHPACRGRIGWLGVGVVQGGAVRRRIRGLG